MCFCSLEQTFLTNQHPASLRGGGAGPLQIQISHIKNKCITKDQKKSLEFLGKEDQMDIAVIVAIVALGIFITVINLWFKR